MPPAPTVVVGTGTGGRQWCGPLHRAAGLLEAQAPGGLGRGVVQVVQEVVSGAVAMAVLRAAGLLGRRGLRAAGVVGVAQGQVGRGWSPAGGVLLAAGGQSGHGCPSASLSHRTGQTSPTLTYGAMANKRRRSWVSSFNTTANTTTCVLVPIIFSVP